MSVSNFALQQLRTISDFCGNSYDEARQYFENYIGLWLGNIELKSSERWQSWITDDNSPFDWSIVITKEGAIPRIVFEPQGEKNDAASMKMKAFEYVKFIAKHSLINDKFLLVEKLLQETSNKNLWFATDFTPSPLFKIYFGGLTDELYQSIYNILEIQSQVSDTIQHLAGFEYLIEGISLDLNEQKDNRVKLYCRISNFETEKVVNLIQKSCKVYDPTVKSLLNAFAIGNNCIIHKRYEGECYIPSNILLTFVYVKNYPRAVCAKVHVPVRFHFSNDESLLSVAAAFIEQNFSASLADSYKKFIQNMAVHRELSKRTGIQSLISYSNTTGDDPELTVYISPEMYAPERYTQP